MLQICVCASPAGLEATTIFVLQHVSNNVFVTSQSSFGRYKLQINWTCAGKGGPVHKPPCMSLSSAEYTYGTERIDVCRVCNVVGNAVHASAGTYRHLQDMHVCSKFY